MNKLSDSKMVLIVGEGLIAIWYWITFKSDPGERLQSLDLNSDASVKKEPFSDKSLPIVIKYNALYRHMLRFYSNYQSIVWWV